MHGSRQSFSWVAVGALAWLLAGSAGAYLVTGTYVDGGPCDPQGTRSVIEEFGDGMTGAAPPGPFPIAEEIDSSSSLTVMVTCSPPTIPGGGDDWEVAITNLSGRSLSDLYFVVDQGFTVGNWDGRINGEQAFRIDGTVTPGVNNPLVFESMVMDEVFQPGETWIFLVSDFLPALPPTPFDSLGIAGASAGFPPSTASIVIVTDPETPPNHFKVYDVDDIAVDLPIPVSLFDQFGANDPVDVVLLDLFANPVSKNGEEIGDPDEHQRWYRIDAGEPQPSRQVTYTNQFGRLKIRVGDPTYLVLPSQKLPHDPPENVDHYQCYEVTWAPHKGKKIVQLVDQFGEENDVEVGDPRYFCNPTEKWADFVPYPIQDPDDHLVCYDIEPKVDHDLVVTTADQFTPFRVEPDLHVRTNDLLCVPSTKEGFALPTLGRWGFATLVGLLMLTTVAWVGYRRRPLAAGSAS